MDSSSQIFSSCDIHDTARWQFCSTTQVPFSTASDIILAAIGPFKENDMKLHQDQQWSTKKEICRPGMILPERRQTGQVDCKRHQQVQRERERDQIESCIYNIDLHIHIHISLYFILFYLKLQFLRKYSLQ